MKIILIALAACLMVAPVANAQPSAVRPAAQAEAAFERGYQLFSARNYRAALPLLSDAAEQGQARAQAMVGRIYDEGLGVQRDPRQAAKWFGQAAAQGHRASQFALGGLYEKGDGVPRDERRASQLFEMSARQGYAPAQFAVGLNYEVGRGVARNRQTALYWLNEAAKQGDNDARVIGYWLKQPGTPVFQTEQQLSSYVSSRMQPRPSAGSSGGVPSGRSFEDKQWERRRCQGIANINDRQACMNNAG